MEEILLVGLYFVLVSGSMYYFIYRPKKVLQKQYQNLYILKDPAVFLVKMDSFESKLLFRKYERLTYCFDAYMMQENYQKIEDLIAFFKDKKIRDIDAIGIYNKEIVYYCITNQKEKAYEVFEELQKRLSKKKNIDIPSYIKEPQMYLNVYFEENSVYLQDLIEKKNKPYFDYYKGQLCMMIAKCYHKQKDASSTQKYLKEALTYVQDTPLAKKVEMILNGNYDLL